MCLKFDLSLKILSKEGPNKPISPFFEDAHIVTDRHTNSLTPWVCGFFLSVKFATSLLASLARGKLHKIKSKPNHKAEAGPNK